MKFRPLNVSFCYIKEFQCQLICPLLASIRLWKNVIEDYLKSLINHQGKKSTSKKILYSSLCVSRCEGDFLQLKSQLFINKLIKREKIIWNQLDKKMNIRFFSAKPAFFVIWCIAKNSSNVYRQNRSFMWEGRKKK